MEPSSKQAAIYHEWETTDNNILIQAVAGSGKTTTLLHLLSLCKYKTLYIAFNKAIQKETEQKLIDRGLVQGKSMTIHSLGLMAIKYVHKNVEIDDKKNWKILTEVEKRRPLYFDMKSGFYKTYEEIMRLRFTLIDMNEVSRVYMENDSELLLDIMVNMDKNIYVNDAIDLKDLWQVMIDVREEFYNKSPLIIDFTDMIYLPARGDYYIPVDPYYLLIDEAQDLNLAQHRLIDNLVNQGDIKKWIAVGDRNQSIYGFSGAFASSFDLFKTKKNVKEMPLDICYRCPTLVIDSANEVYPVLIPHKTDSGVVKTFTNNFTHLKRTPGAMVICRNKGPLIDVYFELIGQEIPCRLHGDDIMGSILRFLGSYKRLSISKAKQDMETELIELISDQSTFLKQIKYAVMAENHKNFVTLFSKLGFSGNDSVSDLMEKFKDLFKGDRDDIILCTIHKSKGLEADIVYILNENLIPSKFARSEQQLIQEQNLKYVARTRAKRQMYFLNFNKPSENEIERKNSSNMGKDSAWG